jgi:hypothetical protein
MVIAGNIRYLALNVTQIKALWQRRIGKCSNSFLLKMPIDVSSYFCQIYTKNGLKV